MLCLINAYRFQNFIQANRQTLFPLHLNKGCSEIIMLRDIRMQYDFILLLW